MTPPPPHKWLIAGEEKKNKKQNKSGWYQEALPLQAPQPHQPTRSFLNNKTKINKKEDPKGDGWTEKKKKVRKIGRVW